MKRKQQKADNGSDFSQSDLQESWNGDDYKEWDADTIAQFSSLIPQDQFDDLPSSRGYEIKDPAYLANAAHRTKMEGELRIHNVLALALLDSKLTIPLDEAIKYFANAIYNPEFFPALRIEIRGPITHSVYTISYYESGRIQSAGGCMPREAGLCMKQVARRLRAKFGVDIKFKNFEIHNLLAVLDMGCNINIAKLQTLAPGQKGFEPSRFPALRVSLPVNHDDDEEKSIPREGAQDGSREQSGRQLTFEERRNAARKVQQSKKRVETVTASIFSNGKINFVGGKSVRSIVKMIDELRPFIEACT